jgi:deoxycytidylate deaminase
MSTRSDFYLALCLQQANKSPLHYRHGCIIVRGGKVIGQGYNTYRPGFNSGALKHGNSVGSLSLSALSKSDFKERLTRNKPKTKPKSKPDTQQPSGTFTPFETLGSGPHANTPLSMHSEMMAIQSALSLAAGAQSSQLSARKAKSCQKPRGGVSGPSKRKARLRALKAYVAAVCSEAAVETGKGKEHRGKSCVQESCFEAASSQSSEGGREGGERAVCGEGIVEGEPWRETRGKEEGGQ